MEKKIKANETRQAKKQREVPPLELEIPAEGKKLNLEIQGDCKTIVDWVNGHAKLKTRESTDYPEPSTAMVGRGVDLRQRTADWASHIFREHNKEAALWAAKGLKGRVVESVDNAQVVWSEVTRLCRFWDGSCDRPLPKHLGSCLQKMWTVTGQNSLDAELGGCGMLLENLRPWIDKSVR